MTGARKKRRIELADLMRMAAEPLVQRHAVRGLEKSDVPSLPLPVPLPQSVIDWLAQASLLYGVPFEYIVPDARMLPRESIRFFYMDVNWLQRMIEGAMSIGVSSSADSIQILTAIQEIVDRTLLSTPQVRARMRGKPLPAEAEQVGPITGFLLRSAAVSGWPGMEVTAYAGETTDSAVLQLLRLDRLSDTILIALFNGLPKRVDILQPPESLHFGIRPNGATFYSFLRGLGYGGHAPGLQIGSVEAPVSMRTDARYPGVVDITKTAASLKNALKTQNALDTAETFTSAEFAVQMVRAAGLQSFEWGVAPTAAQGGKSQ
ncbi:hypothetical protein J2T09_005407 [Neorhizobium huautlense]|uniref:Uncharacterized protein n=1 Tax=Neorhizobium huautlense TaxID=67774 RepID=A0ABT9Q3F8_9HYPH|nr:hypothetical protein [Neorhizobium huautlense]MDP9840619.1 hypothetical protein [Neorhizobium huautlense]